ncbi:RND transporter [Pantoea coffeiphila]|uniref:RND transporter n=1 Tax=Pantoea coffeiphila TaxID=1465635 RepID=UPI001960C97F|nr:RND transporter [Pantoea coffeiphila]MBM7341018.1 hypothetical protein [Pantoea coffeiphila]
MSKIVVLSLVYALASFTDFAQAADCEPNGLGGYSCVNDDGSTSDSMPNEAGGTDILSSNGNLTSSDPDDVDDNAELDDPSPITNNGSANINTNDALKGKDWNAPSNINDGSATSSMDMINQP